MQQAPTAQPDAPVAYPAQELRPIHTFERCAKHGIGFTRTTFDVPGFTQSMIWGSECPEGNDNCQCRKAAKGE